MIWGCWEENTYGSMLTGVASLIADRTGGVMSQLSKEAVTQNALSDVIRQVSVVITAYYKCSKLATVYMSCNNSGIFMNLFSFHLLERNRLRVADLGVAGGGRPWLLAAAAAAEDRKVEK